MLEDWVDEDGRKHFGLIDKTHDVYSGYSKLYRNAVDKIRLISPTKYRTQMVEEFIELINLGVIRFPFEYNRQDFIRIPKEAEKKKGVKCEDEEFDTYYLSQEERLSYTQIDLMKQEVTSIYKTSNPENTSIRYALAKEKENKMHDDRFYTIILCAHRLYELRRSSTMRTRKSGNKDISPLLQMRAPKIY